VAGAILDQVNVRSHEPVILDHGFVPIDDVTVPVKILVPVNSDAPVPIKREILVLVQVLVAIQDILVAIQILVPVNADLVKIQEDLIHSAGELDGVALASRHQNLQGS